MLRSIIFALFAAPAMAAGPVITVEKTESCGCCVAWIEHLEENGFTVEAHNRSHGMLVRSKIEKGLTPPHFSCHTATVGGYVVEGHVPAREITRLLKEKPTAIGLSVPQMPIGSPGMDFGDGREPYDVLLVQPGGVAKTFASYD